MGPVVGGTPLLIDVDHHKLCLWVSETAALTEPFNKLATDRLWAAFAEDVVTLFCERDIPRVHGVAVVIEPALSDLDGVAST